MGQGGVKLALGSHNVRSIAHTLALLEQKGLPLSAVEIQKLYGMADPLRRRWWSKACEFASTCPWAR